MHTCSGSLAMSPEGARALMHCAEDFNGPVGGAGSRYREGCLMVYRFCGVAQRIARGSQGGACAPRSQVSAPGCVLTQRQPGEWHGSWVATPEGIQALKRSTEVPDAGAA